MTNSVYIHIPFCNNICSYCNFSKFLYNEKMVYDYLNALEKENPYLIAIYKEVKNRPRYIVEEYLNK